VSNVEIESGAGAIDALFELPAGRGPWPGVVVVHDLPGLSADIHGVTRRIAENGFLALAPDLYARGGRARCVVRVMREMLAFQGLSVTDIFAARDHLVQRADCTGMVGVVGFCLGGGFALVTAPGFDVAAPFYPSIPPKYDTLLQQACPIVASYGRRDPINIGNGERLRAALQRKGIPHDVKVYSGVGHSFANQVPAQAIARIVGFGHNAAATEDAFNRVFAFFDLHLR
jgi:carboxymethylenebutenolidase